jgi:hypothetical protein
VKIVNVSLFSLARDLVQPSSGVRLRARFRSVVMGIVNFDFHLHCVPAALDPSFSLLAFY